MEYMQEPSYHHFQQLHQHDGLPSDLGMGPYSGHSMHSYPHAMAHQSSNMMGLPSTKNETKPRLGKDEVDILEKEFQRNPKPTTQTKKKYADSMSVDLARINNWFQNRRAKRKQEKKQEDFAMQQGQDASSYSEPSSPDFNGSFAESQFMLPQHSYTFPMAGPPQPIAPYNPQYADPTTASMESLQRTLAAAQQASYTSQRPDFPINFHEQSEPFEPFGGPLLPSSDRAEFPSVDASHDAFHGQSYTPIFGNSNNMYNHSNPSITELHESPIAETPTTFQQFSTVSQGMGMHGSQSMPTFPSQLLPSDPQDDYSSLPEDNTISESPEDSIASAQAIGFKFDDENSNTSSPPGPSIPFRSPAPMDIASRRKKVAVKPAALTADAMKNRPAMGPRTVSHAENLRRASGSPMGSPMRRVMSANGLKNVISGRISKNGFESAQRSPINLGGFPDAGSFMERNYHTIRQPPSLTAGSSLNSSLAPPTPMSPRGFEASLGKREHMGPTSPGHGGLSYMFSAGLNRDLPAYLRSADGDQNLTSPPETPHIQGQLALQAAVTHNPWIDGNDPNDRAWGFDLVDDPLFTPAIENFQPDLQTPQPSYLNSMSQPNTPAFGQQFNPNFMFNGQESPRFKHDSPQYTLASHTEYNFPEQQYNGRLSTSPMSKQKTFQFSNQTPADFSATEKK